MNRLMRVLGVFWKVDPLPCFRTTCNRPLWIYLGQEVREHVPNGRAVDWRCVQWERSVSPTTRPHGKALLLATFPMATVLTVMLPGAEQRLQGKRCVWLAGVHQQRREADATEFNTLFSVCVCVYSLKKKSLFILMLPPSINLNCFEIVMYKCVWICYIVLHLKLLS